MDTHNSQHQVLANLTNWSEEYLTRYREVQINPTLLLNVQSSAIQTPPPGGLVKINVDAAFPGQSSEFWVGLVASDYSDACIWWN